MDACERDGTVCAWTRGAVQSARQKMMDSKRIVVVA
jgi:hypothetical protein